MTEQELFQAILEAEAADGELTEILEKIRNKTATFQDTQRYSLRSAEIRAKILSQHLSPAGSGQNEESCYQLLQDQHKDVNQKAAAVQKILDEKQNLHISPAIAAFPAERVRKAAHSLEDMTVSEDVLRRRAENAVANIAASFHDDYIKENSEFRQKAGLTCHVSRIGAFKCCAWCARLAGRYEKGREPADFWKRHDKCTCQISYETQKLRQRLSGTGRGWKVDSEVHRRQVQAIQYKPTRFTREQAQALESQQLSQYRGLTIAGKTNKIVNQSRALEIFNAYDIPETARISAQNILNDLETTNIGKEVLSYLKEQEIRPKLTYDHRSGGVRGEEIGGEIFIYLSNCKDIKTAACTVIHECTHRRYGIGQSQWSECVCIAQEIKHRRGRNDLTESERRVIIKAVKEAYPEFNWRKGGIIRGRRSKSGR